MRVGEEAKVKTNRGRNKALHSPRRWAAGFARGGCLASASGAGRSLTQFSVFNALDKDLASTCHRPGTIPCVGDSAVKRTDTILTPAVIIF